MANESSEAVAQSPTPTTAEGQPASSEVIPSNLSPAEQFAGLDLEQLQEITARLSPDRVAGTEGVDAGAQPPAAQALSAEEIPPVEAEIEPQPAATVVEQPKAEEPPGRMRIDRLGDERTREIAAFLSRNHDATVDDAIAYVDGRKASQKQEAAGPDLSGLESDLAQINQQLAGIDPSAEGYDHRAHDALRDKRDDLRLDLRFAKQDAQRQTERQAASVYDQRTQARLASAESAIAMCPEINDLNTPQGKEYAALFDRYTASNDPVLHNDEVPELLALKVMRATGYVPKAPASEIPPASTPPKPAATQPPAPAIRSTVPIARPTAPTPATAPGSSRISQAVAPSAAQLADALHDMDLSTLEQVAEAAGRKLAPAPAPYSFA